MWASMRPQVRLSRRPLPPTILEMDNYCLSCLTRSTQTSRRSQGTAAMTRMHAIRRSVRVKPRRRSRQDVAPVTGSTATQKLCREPRDKNLRYIRGIGCAAWKQKLGYHRRSKALDGGVSDQDHRRSIGCAHDCLRHRVQRYSSAAVP